MKNINARIKVAVDNTNRLMLGEFDFDPQKILNETLIFDTSKIEEEIIVERIIDALSDKNNEFYIENSPGKNYFTLRRENGR